MVKSSENKDEPNDIDFILNDIGGTFGKFQIYNYLMLAYGMFVTGAVVMDYVFSALVINHRCAIPECDNPNDVTFNPNWLTYAVPFKNDHPDSCYRFSGVRNGNTSENLCNVDSFDRSTISYCGDGPMIYRTDEWSILNEFNLTCDENRWKLAMVGTISNIGRLVFLSIMGYLSDRFGRKKVLVCSGLLSSVLKLFKSFATSYNMFVFFEFLDAGVASAIYPAVLILGMEWATTEHSILVSCIVLSSSPIGVFITGLIASYLHNYKWLLRALSLVGFTMFPFIWLLPESIRWLLVNRKYDDAIKLIEKAAKTNGIELSPKTYEIIESKCKSNGTDEVSSNQSKHGSFKDIVTSCSLLTRFAICTFCWVSSTFITYGVSIVSVSFPGDKYFNFMVINIGALPAIFITYFMLKYLRRRWSLSVSYFVCGLSILASKFFPSYTLSIIFFILGKLFIHHGFAALYVYTSEMWPTIFRHSVMGICSTIARFGSIAAPLSPLLADVMELLPFYLFGGFACLAAVMILFLPETFRQEKLPDTVQDIKNLDKKDQIV